MHIESVRWRGRPPAHAHSRTGLGCTAPQARSLSRDFLIHENANATVLFTVSLPAGVAELADARDLKSLAPKEAYRFDSGLRHHPEPTGIRRGVYGFDSAH